MRIVVDYDFHDIKNEEHIKLIEKYKTTIKKCMKLCLENEKIDGKEIGIYIRFTTNGKIKNINKKFRNIDKATDVLSFPMYEKKELKHIKDSEIPATLGDIIVSVEKIETQAKEYGHTFKRELMYLITHAMFHLLGYDHLEEKDKKQMRTREEKIMNILNISR